MSRSLLGTVDIDNRIPVGQPLRVIRDIVNTTLRAASAEFDALVSPAGRALRPPKRLLRPLLLQTFDPIRPARQLVERIEFGRLIR